MWIRGFLGGWWGLVGWLVDFLFLNDFLLLQMEYLVAVLAQIELLNVKFQCTYRQVIDHVNC